MPKRYTEQEKKKVIKYADKHGVMAACGKFHVSAPSIYLWRKQADEAAAIEEESLTTPAFMSTQIPEDIGDLQIAMKLANSLVIALQRLESRQAQPA